MNNKIFSSAGKIILSGEHSVVYGEPAIVCSINLKIQSCLIDRKNNSSKENFEEKLIKENFILQKKNQYLENIFKIFENKYGNNKFQTTQFKTYIKSSLPTRSGLGSSAAFAHVIFLSLLDKFNIKLNKEDVFQLVLEAENFAHGTSSGVDPSAVVFGGAQVYKKIENQNSTSNQLFTRKILKNFPQLNIVLISSGQPMESTKEMVELVGLKVRKEKSDTEKNTLKIINKIGLTTTKIIKNFKDKKFDFNLITQNERLLEELGVVGSKAQQLIHKIESIGGYAKITGAGGVKKGSGLVLVFHTNKDKLNEFLDKNGIESYEIEVK